MNKELQLIDQIKIVLGILEKDYIQDISSGVLQLIYKRYKNARGVLEARKDIKAINIKGGVRAYMDSYNDYNNPLLEEMYKAEKLTEELLLQL
ncbi:hypothetical protein [Aquibacillus kalidii]|uniref:hypothetical protein n=1 Tax=Aquibacillus kalidii TaxID=2762597 RepID=UPI0016452517|nr:hypothetical protein [Aquibacillus kalidii]